MRISLDRATRLAALSEIISSPGRLAEIHAATQVPEGVAQWLGRLRMLHGVPFNYLVPDEAMLPDESIRFFQVDPAWTYALIEGAFSIGRASSSDRAHDGVMGRRLHNDAADASRRLRGMRAGDAEVSGAVTGFLLRSSVVAGWPGMEVTAYDAAGAALGILRMDRISSSILLLMVEGVIDHVDISEPSEGLHFGVEADGGKVLRYVTVPSGAPHGKKPGSEIDGVTTGAAPMRERGVLKVNSLARAIGDTLSRIGANNDAETGKALPFTSAEFAMEMVEGGRRVRFINKG